MRAFRDAPIKRKLTLVIALTSTSALLLATVAAVAYEIAHFRHETVLDLQGQARMIAAVSASALASGDQALVRKVLSALSTQSEVVSAWVLGPTGQPFAEYVRADADFSREAASPLPPGSHFKRGLIYFSHPIVQDDHKLGIIVLCADPRKLQARLKGGASILVVVVLASLVLALVLGARLQRIVSDPILRLARLAQNAAARQDYSLRGTKEADDEIGLLVDRFNDMLGQIQHREEGLRASEQRFRQLAESIREVFWLTDAAKTEMLYISPGYEHIWGRTCDSLRESPRDWLEAIHPDDLARVQDAALTKQVRGDYDEEYRIQRPDGSIRWIHDRAFPVRDASGQVYRVAGIAEDITQRKQLEKQVLEISDHEHARIGEDLHDGLCQLLVSIGFHANLLKVDLEARALPEAINAERVARKLTEAVGLARHLAHGLHPFSLPPEGLGPALQILAADISQDFAVTCAAECADSVTVRDPQVATHLYQIAREAVHNAVKHAHPGRITIRLTANHRTAHLTIADDGRGITLPPKPGAGMGLAMMRYRAGMIGGTLEVQRADAGGTIVTCTFQPASAS